MAEPAPARRRLPRRRLSPRSLRPFAAALLAAALAIALLPLPPATTPAAAQAAWTPGLTATPGYKQFELNWTAATDCCGPALTYEKYRVEYKGPSDPNFVAARSVESTTTSATLSGLGAGVQYTLRIGRVPSGGAIDYDSTQITATTLASAKPDAPAITAASGSTGITVAWTAPANNGSAITGYKLQWRNSDSSATDGTYSSSARQRTPGATATTDTIPTASLTEDNEYTIRLAATNANGDSDWSAEATATDWPTKPIIAAAPTLTAGNGTLAASWTTNDTGSAVTGSQTAHRSGTHTCAQAASGGTTASVSGTTAAATLSSLTNGTSYTVCVRATNAKGTGEWSPAASGTPVAQAPGAPTGLTATAGNQKLALSWTAPSDNGGSAITGYKVQWKSGAQEFSSTRERSVTGAVTSYDLTGLTNATAYTVQIRAVNGEGDGTWSATATGTPAAAAPGVPTALRLAPAAGKLSATWTAPASNGAAISSYTVQWRSDAQTFDTTRQGTTASVPTTASPYDIGSLTDGTKYWVRVRATNSAGSSGWSTPVSATAGASLPVSADMARKISGSTTVKTSQFPFSDPNNHALAYVQFVSLPDSTQGTFKLKRTHRLYKRHPATDVTAGQKVDNEQRQLSIRRQRLYFVPTGSFTEATFTFRVIDEKNQTSNLVYTGTLTKAATGAAPTPTATVGTQQVTLSWPKLTTMNAAKWQYRYKTAAQTNYPTTGAGSWTDVPSGGPNTTSHTITGLTTAGAYTFQIRAGNALVICASIDPACSVSDGWTAVSAEVTATPRGNAVPAAPARLHASAGPSANQITVSWDNPYNSTITRWQYNRIKSRRTQVHASPCGFNNLSETSGWTDITSSGANTTYATIATDGDNYCYRVQIRAVNSDGNGTHTQSSTVNEPSTAQTPTFSAPAAPHNVTAAAGDQAVALTWDDPHTNDLAISKYQYQYKTDGSYGSWTDLTGTDHNTTTATVSGLTNATAHTFKIRAHGPSSAGAASAEVTVTPTAPASAPGQVTGVTADSGNARIRLSWSAPTGSVVKYQYNQKKGAGSYAGWTDVPGLTVRSFGLTELTNGTVYKYKVRAVNGAGDGAESAEVSVIPNPLAAPILCDDDTPDDGDPLTTTDGDDDGDGLTRHSSCALGGSYSADSVLAVRWALASADTRITGWQVRMRHVGTCTVNQKDGTPIDIPCQWSSWETVNDNSLTHSSRAANLVSTAKVYLSSIANEISLAVGGFGDVYDIQLRSQTSLETGPASNTIRLAGYPANISNFRVRAGNAKIYLSWDDPENSSITHYEILAVKSAPTPVKLYSQIKLAGTSASTTSLTLTSLVDSSTDPDTTDALVNGNTYQLQLYVTNKWGTKGPVSSVPGSVTPSATAAAAPAAPTGLTATGGTRQIALSWTDPDDEYITKYEVRWKKTTDANYPTSGTGSWAGTPTIASSATSHTITGLEVGKSYNVQVRAVNNSTSNTDRWGTAASATATTLIAVPAAPDDVLLVATTGWVTFRWRDPADSTITRWEFRQEDSAGNWQQNWKTLNDDTVTCWKHQPDPPPAKWIVDSAKAGVCGTYAVNGADADNKGNTLDGGYGIVIDTGNVQRPIGRATANNLSQGSEAVFQLRAVNAGGPGPAATLMQVRPVNLGATQGDQEVALGWTGPRPAHNGVRTWQYRYRLSSNSDYPTSGTGSWTTVPSSTASTRSYTVTGLTNGSRYVFQVRPRSGTTDGPPSNEAYQRAGPVPSAPASVTATAGVRQASLAWTLTTADSTISGWQYRYKTTGSYPSTGPGSWTSVASATHATRSASVTGLTSGAAYTFQVRAVNGTGNGASATSAAATPTPAAPTGLSAARASATSATLTWANPGDSGISKYQYRKKTSGSFSGSWTDVPSSSGTSTSGTVTGLTGTTSWTFQIRAASGTGGATPGLGSSSATMPPAAPSGLTGTGGNQRVKLTWTDPSDSSITGYEVRSREGSAKPWSLWASLGSSATSHTFRNLKNGTQYSFELRAKNVGGTSTSSASATPTAGPAKPTGLSAVAGDGSAALSWTDPANSAITKWQYRCWQSSGTEPSSWTDIGSSSATTTSHTATGLTNKKAHQCRVRAHTALDPGTASDTVTVTPWPKPAAPSGLAAAVSGANAVKLTWTALGDTSVTGFEARYKETSASGYPTSGTGSWTAISGSRNVTTTHTVTGLTGGTGYTFQVRAANASGKGASSTASATAAVRALTPANLTATATSQKVTLSWDKPSDYASLTRYQVRRKEGTAEWGAWVGIGKGAAAGTKVSHAATALTNGTTYTFQVRAVNAAGNSAASSEASATPEDPPAKPTGLTATAGDGQVTLGWTDPSDSDITGYQIRRRSPVLGTWADISSSSATTVSHTVSTLTNGTEYTFELRAKSAMGVGPFATATATPLAKPAKPTAISAAPRNAGALVSWTAAADSSITKWEYLQKDGTNAWASTWTQISTAAGTRSVTVQSLTNSTVYQFKVRAVNASGNGAESDAVSVTPIPPPSAPTGVSVTALSGGRAQLSWTNPSNSTITSWQYRYRTSGDVYPVDGLKNPVWTTVPGSVAGTTSVTVPSLSGDKQYAMQVRAVNAAGAGSASSEVTVTAYAGPDGASALTAAPGDSSATLSWTAAANSSITRWQYRLRTVATWAGIGWQNVPSSGASTRSTSIGSLANDTEYVFQVRPVDSKGGGLPSPEASVTPIAPPEAPSGLSLSLAAGAAATTFNWTASWRNTQGRVVSAWQYQTRSASNNTWGSWQLMSASSVSKTGSVYSYTVSGETRNSINAVRMRARNAVGDSSASSSATLSVNKPTGLSATPKHTAAELSWTALGNSLVTKWQVRRKDAGSYGAWADVPSSGAATTSATVGSLTNNTAYSFQVRAVTHATDGPASDAATATPKARPAKPSGLSAVGKATSADLSWTALGDTTVSGWQVSYKQSAASEYGAWADVSSSGAATTSATVGSLTNGTEYSLRVRAVNRYGASEPSDAATATPEAVPAAPSGLSVTGGDGQLSLSWTDPNDDTIDKWQYRTRVSGGAYGDWTDVASSNADTTSATVSSLDNGKAYDVQVRAWNNNGGGAASTVSGVGTEPVAPAGFTATGGNASVALAWTDPSNGSITDWQYRYKTPAVNSGNYGSWTSVQGATATTTSATVSTLTNLSAYTFQLRAVNPAGNGPASSEDSAVPAAGVPAAPATLSATGSGTSVNLAWTLATANASITHWEQRHKQGSGSYGNWIDIASSGAATRSASIALLAGRQWTFQVRAVNDRGNSGSATSGTTRTVPVAPFGLTAVPKDAHATVVVGTKLDPSITGLEAQATPDGGSPGAWSGVTVTQKYSGDIAITWRGVVYGLTNGTAQELRLRARNAAGVSAVSAAVTITPIAVPAKPTGFTATAGSRQASLAWTDPSNGTITGWQYRTKESGGSWGEWTAISGSTASTTSHTVTGLANGKSHVFQVRAVNASGDGVASDEKSVRLAPGAPSGLSAAPRHGFVILSWAAQGDSTVNQWQYRYGTSKPLSGAWTNFSTSAAATTVNVTSLTNGTTYHFEVRARSSAGAGDTASVSKAPVARPSAPSGLSGTATDTSIAVSWTDLGDSSVTGWEYRYKKGAGNYGSWTDVAGSDDDTTSFTVASLDHGAAYTFQVRAVNDSGDGATGTAAAVSTSPAATSSISSSVSVTTVTLTWADDGDDSITGWQYQQRKGAAGWGSWTAVSGSDKDTTTVEVASLDHGAKYTFRVRAVNAAGNGVASSETARDTSPAAPSGLTVSISDTTATLRWTRTSDSTVTGWQYQQSKDAGSYGSWTNVAGSVKNTTTATVSGLDHGANYGFKIRAVNAAGGGAASAAASDDTAPAAPTGLAASASVATITVSWTDPGDDTITGWEYRQKKGTGNYGSWTEVANSDKDTTSVAVSGLDYGATYSYQVRAVNPAGNGALPAAVSAPTAPAAPGGFTAAGGLTGTTATMALAWTNPSISTITKWQYRKTSAYTGIGESRAPDWSSASWADVCVTSTTPGCPSVTSHSLTSGLSLGTEYTFQLRAVTASGAGDAAQASSWTAGTKPTGLTAEARDTAAALAWADPGNAGISRWAYRWKLSTDSGFDCTGAKASRCGQWSDSTASTTSGDVTGLTNGTAYDFQVRSLSTRGNSPWSDSASATPVDSPSMPANFSATGGNDAQGNAQAVLAWDDPSDATITSWEYRFRTAGGAYGSWTTVPSSTATTTTYTKTGLSNGNSYDFRVRAVNSAGSGAASDEATALMIPAKPAGVAAAAGLNVADLSWTDPGNGSISRWEYRYKTDGSFPRNCTADDPPVCTDAWTTVPSSRATTASYRVTGLENAVEHTFEVRAVNATGSGVASDGVTVTPVAIVNKPASLTVAFRDALSLSYKWTLTWTDPDGWADADITHWQVRTQRPDGVWADWATIASSDEDTRTYQSLATTARDSVVSAQVRAVNGAGNGDAATVRFLPDKPSGLRLTRVVPPTQAAYQIDLAWDALGDTSVDRWQRRQRQPGGNWSQWRDLSGTDASSTGYSGLTIAAVPQMEVQVRAMNEAGAGTASDAATVTMTPAAPTLTATRCDTVTANTNDACGSSTDDREVGLTWAVSPADGTITTWHYRYRAVGGEWPQNCTTDTPPVCTDYWRRVSKPAGVNLKDVRAQLVASGLRHGNAYEFQVRASSLAGIGLPQASTATPTVTMRPAQPQTISVSNTAQNGTQLEVEWGASAGAAEYEYQYNAINGTGPPAKPANLSATAGNASVTLSWDSVNDLTVTRFDVRWKKTSATADGSWTPIPSSSYATTSHTVSRLANESEYSFEVRAVRPGAPGPASDTVTATPSTSPSNHVRSTPQPAAQASPTQAAQGQNCPAEGDWHLVATTTVEVTCLTEGTEYAFQVRGTMANRTDPGEPSSVVVAVPAQVPGAPSGLSASPVVGGLDLEWNPGTEPRGEPITGWSYRCKVKKLDGTYGDWSAWAAIPDSDELTTTHQVLGLPHAGVACQVRAHNNVGEGLPSNESPETVPYPVPTPRGGPTGGTGGSGGGGVVAPALASSLRLGGSDRYATALRAADQYVTDIADVAFVSTAIVVSGENFPDALAAAALSGKLKAPVLLVPRDTLPSGVGSFLVRHEFSNVRIVGGTAAVSDAVKEAIEALDTEPAVTRIAGADRFATAAAVAEEVGTPGVLCGITRRTVIVASGTSWPDAVVAGPIAYRGGHPVLLTSAGSLPDATRRYLRGSGATHVLVLGGTAVVSEAVQRQIEGLVPFVTRVAGADRYSTATALATYLGKGRSRPTAGAKCLGDDTVGLVTGVSFPDALTAAPLLGWYGAPVLLTPPDRLPATVAEYVAGPYYRPAEDIIEVIVIGGRTAVPSARLRDIAAAKDPPPADDTAQP